MRGKRERERGKEGEEELQDKIEGEGGCEDHSACPRLLHSVLW